MPPKLFNSLQVAAILVGLGWAMVSQPMSDGIGFLVAGALMLFLGARTILLMVAVLIVLLLSKRYPNLERIMRTPVIGRRTV